MAISPYSQGQKITASAINSNFSALDSGINQQLNRELFPSRIICLWASSEIPEGWKICDGTNGTPDLRNLFALGASDVYALGSTGGSETHTLSLSETPSHSHEAGTLSLSSAGSHLHTHNYRTRTRGNEMNTSNNNQWRGDSNISTGSSGAHTHSISGSLDSSGEGQPHENRPPYYALHFIMKE